MILGRNSENAYSGMSAPVYRSMHSHVRGATIASQMSRVCRRSPAAENWSSRCSRRTTCVRSGSLRNLAESGKSCTIQKLRTPATTVARPSSMKIQDLTWRLVEEHADKEKQCSYHEALPPTLCMLEIAAARSPPNAPEIVAAAKKTAARIPNSERLYQQLR
jgi:hypothetical protein